MKDALLRLPVRRLASWTVVGVGVVVALVLTWQALGVQLFLDLTVAGLTFGSIASLSGVGLVVTYKATGVFNFAHGAIAVFIAYILWQLSQWGVPIGIAAPLAMLIAAPLLGIGLERVVFRPLSERSASTAENLVATIGVFVVMLGVMTAVWGLGTKTNPPALFPGDSVCVGACADGADGLVIRFGVDQMLTILTLGAVTALLWWLFSRSTLGTDIKAVVDRRELAQLTAVNANRVSATSWALGATFAGLTGVLLAPVATGSLDPFRLTLLVVETFAVAIVARLTSLPRAVLAGLGIGLASSYLTQFSFAYPVHWIADLTGADLDGVARSVSSALDQLMTSLPVVVFLGALLFMRNLDAGGDDDGGSGSFVARMTAAGSRSVGRSNAVTVLIVSVVAVALPFAIGDNLSLMADAHEMLALAIIFLSIIVVTGFSGHITLAQAGFGGVGALVAARTSNLGVPVILSAFVGGLVCVPIGIGAGYPALRRRGLFLGLTTLALGLVLERGVLQNLYFFGGQGDTTFDAPVLFGLDLGGDVAFWFYELAILVLMIVVARNLQRSRIGRVLGAMRDSETGARSIALNLQTYKLFIFALGAFMAGVGGALLSQGRGSYGEQDFVTINGLLWFAVVVVAGVGSIYGAVVGAFLFTLLGSLLGESGVSTLIVGLAAVFLGRLPGGLVGGVKRLVTAGPGALVPREVLEESGEDETARRARLRPSPVALERIEQRRQAVS